MSGSGMLGDIERRFCDCGGMSVSRELGRAQHIAGTQQAEGSRNIANCPDYLEKHNAAMIKEAMARREQMRRQAVYLIKQQPFYV